MKKIRIFNDFKNQINEDVNDLHKIIMCVSSDISDFDYVTSDAARARQYMELFTRGDNSKTVTLPVINFCNIHTRRLIKAGTSEDLVYNKEEIKQEIASKVKWHKTHKDSKHVPKTVLDANKIDQLKFPIIAKPENRYSGQGIQKFDTLEDAKSADLSIFEVFSEQVDVADEYRVMMWRGEPQMWVHRIPADDKTKNMDKSTEDKLKFNYVLERLEDIPADWQQVFDEFTEAHKNLDIYSIDLMIDTDGKPWVVEMSSEFAPLYGVMAFFYKKVYQDYYGKELNPNDEAQIDLYQKEDIEATIKSDAKRFSVKK